MILHQKSHHIAHTRVVGFVPRLALLSAWLLAVFVAVTSCQATALAQPVWKQVPGVYRMQLGAFRVTVLSDGTALRDLSKIMSKPAEVRDAFSKAHETLPTELSINCFLIDTGAHKILVDTGAGELFGVGSGGLIAAMRAAGYEPDSIDVILLTHIHADHSGGLSVGGERLFRNAMVYVDRRDPDYWLSSAVEAAAPDAFKKTFAQSHQTVDPYVRAGRLQPFDGRTVLFPGISSVPEHGHTPGHSAYLIESEGQRLLLWGDVIHAAEVQFRDPTVTIDFDVDRDAAIASRRQALLSASQDGYLVGGAHLSFPGIGHVRADGDGFAWMPAPYSAAMPAGQTIGKGAAR